MTAGTLSLAGLTRRFDGRLAVEDLTLDVAPGELLALVGASGSGKTTTLRMVAGYEQPDSGAVLLDGRDITGIAPQRRGFGMVFQHYALFPHMTVGENVAFGLEARGARRQERTARAARALAAVGLEGAADRPVQQLSGGEQQRVALARAMIIEPPVLLLDEPLSNLDPTLRRTMRNEMRATLRRLAVTTLFVTHDQEDAFAVADRIALLRLGRLLQVGTPEELYDAPRSREVAEFIGRAALVPGELDGRAISIRIGGVERRVGARAPDGAANGDGALAVLRPDSLGLTAVDGVDSWPGTVSARRFAGASLAYHVLLDGGIEVEVASAKRDVREGDRVGVGIVRETVAVVAA
ncbi:MAG: ABC transporter ATP-binding protein [Gemmatimonadaceae bacterium]